MANIKSAKKRAKTNEIRRKRNVARRSEIKTATKKVLDALQANDLAGAKEFMKEAESKMARACGKGLLKKNTAARRVGRLVRRIAQKAKGS